ncbi:MAG: hypothetical protein EA380_06970 [Phycisphaeraceae bacterium]|nr:MAG: hypothetical protein EA380_06970 [Phycisphaeraceae bacterium]
MLRHHLTPETVAPRDGYPSTRLRGLEIMLHERFVRNGVGNVSAALVLCLLAGSASGQVIWKSETASDPQAIGALLEARQLGPARRALPAEQLREVFEQFRDAGETRRVVMHFTDEPSLDKRAELATQGITLLSPLGGGAYFVRVDAPRLQIDQLVGAAQVVEVESIRPEWKTSPFILQDQYPDFAKATDDEGVEQWAALVVWHSDVALEDAKRTIARTGLAVRGEVRQTNTLVVEGPADEVRALIDLDEVQWVEPPIPMLSELNAGARNALQVNQLNNAPYNLDGTGITVMVYDGGVARNTHVDFEGRLTVHDGSGLSNHATHVAGTIGGGGVANSTHRGMAPGTQLRSFGFQWSGGGTFLYTNPGDLVQDYTTAFGSLGAMVSNNSIGTNVATNGFPCSMHGDYSLTCSIIDSLIYDGIGGNRVRIFWAGGNERQSTRCNVEGYGSYYSIAPPSGAKNHIAIGAINSNNNSMTSFSSWGPTDDGRIRPDLVAPGCASGGGITSTSSSSNTAYSTSCGTSMACPAATGAAALVMQDYAAQFPSEPLMSNSLLKTILIQTATDLGTFGPNYQFGWGLINTPAAVEFVRNGSFFEDEVGNSEVVQARLVVPPGQTELRITLAWDDAPGTPNAGVALVNDLDLVVRDPSGVQRFPWGLDQFSPSSPAVRNAPDRRNNVEQVFVEGPAPGEWTVEVLGYSVPSGIQKFSIAASHQLEQVGIQMLLNSQIQEYVPAGEPQTYEVQITNVNDDIVPGSAQMFYRDHPSDSFAAVPLSNVGGNLWSAVLPGQSCDSQPQFYFRVEGEESGVRFLPFGGPDSPYEFQIGVLEDVFLDDFTTDLGWTVGEFDMGETAVRGNWTRMPPEPTAAQPGSAVVGDECWVTDGRAGSSLGAWDVDEGRTTLTSPPIDLSEKADATISYYRWFSNDTGAAPNSDPFFVDITNDGGATWVNVETVGPAGPGTSGGWIFHQFNVADFVTPTALVRIRFTAQDFDPQSLVEAAVDDFKVVSFECVDVTPPPPGCPGDINGDGVVDLDDFIILAGNFGSTNALPSEGDINGDGVVDLDDFIILAGNFGTTCPND